MNDLQTFVRAFRLEANEMNERARQMILQAKQEKAPKTSISAVIGAIIGIIA